MMKRVEIVSGSPSVSPAMPSSHLPADGEEMGERTAKAAVIGMWGVAWATRWGGVEGFVGGRSKTVIDTGATTSPDVG